MWISISVGQLKAEFLQRCMDAVLAADQDRRGRTLGRVKSMAARTIFSSSPSAKTTLLGSARTLSMIMSSALAVRSSRPESSRV